MLPATLTQELIDKASDITTGEFDAILESIDDNGMNELIDEVVAKIRERLSLTDEQEEELFERLSWKFFLIPPTS